MKSTLCLPFCIAVIALALCGNATTIDIDYSANPISPDGNGKYWIQSDSMKAAFIPYGAAITNLLIHDQYGIERDVVAGFDHASDYSADRQHPHYGSVPGRYANRIRNSTFTIDGIDYHVAPNDNGGRDTLHGGPDSWDYHNFTVVSHTNDSITFSYVDHAGNEGFPGEVIFSVTYSLRGMVWDLEMVANAVTAKTPIMLTSHTYLNLDGFANNETNTALNHTLWMPYSGQRIGIDNIQVPTGNILPNTQGSVNDFWSKPKQVGVSFGSSEIENNCGLNCSAYDNCFTINREQLGTYAWRTQGPVARLSSSWSGINLNLYTDQDAVQLFTCNNMNSSEPLKNTQGVQGKDKGKYPRTIPKYGCVVLEAQDYIDGINQPEWMRGPMQIFGPADGPYLWHASYEFGVTEPGTKG